MEEYTQAELKELLKEQGLPVSGNKQEQFDRLQVCAHMCISTLLTPLTIREV